MKTIKNIQAQVSTNREEWFQYRRTLEANLSTLETFYAAQYDPDSPLYHSNPDQTVAAFVEAVGYESAVEVVASLVNRSAWDGRISRRSAEWASTQENSWDEEACSRLSFYSSCIHTAHLDQIAEAAMRYKPRNTRIEFLYRDASNYKVAQEIIVPGDLSKKQKDTIESCLICGEFFVPSEVGLPERRFPGEWTEDDHDLFELSIEDISATDDEPTVDISTTELVENFLKAAERWKKYY